MTTSVLLGWSPAMVSVALEAAGSLKHRAEAVSHSQAPPMRGIKPPRARYVLGRRDLLSHWQEGAIFDCAARPYPCMLDWPEC